VLSVYLAFATEACYDYCPCSSLVATVEEAYYFHHHCYEMTDCFSAAVVVVRITVIATSTSGSDHSIADAAAGGPNC